MVPVMAIQMSPNVRWHTGSVTREERERTYRQRGAVLWFTGLSGSGKSTVAHAVERTLMDRGAIAYVLDGDNVRHGLNGDLGFSPEDRAENVRRVGEVAKLLTDAGVLSLCAFVSPYRQDRDRIRAALDEGSFIEVFVSASVAECERRDTKGLYRQAREGKLSNLTGVDAPYEQPLSPEITLHTGAESSEESAERVIAYLMKNGYLISAQKLFEPIPG